MTDGHDPLGKRALFWAPATRVEEEPIPGREPVVAGKYALFSGAESQDEAHGRANGRGTSLVPPVTLECSACGETSDVDVIGYLGLHLPFFFWRPGRGFTRFMVCPACRRRTWVSASWTPWSAR
ncbi:MAG TPA: hypothetical protein VKR22_01610 [Acidimicrobiales bacterium]|nr:hypothetical protein [Acidimicrobiales bacterium]